MPDVSPALPAGLSDLLQARYQATPRWLASAPGRVNLLGDHTDYAAGLAMPMAIDLATVALAAPGPAHGGQLRIYSRDFGEACFDAATASSRAGDWSDYLRGVHAGFLRRGARVPALDIVIGSSVPPGAGLSSSASLELCLAALLELVCDLPLRRAERALLCQDAEHEYAGVPCGILDQFAISFARAGSALILDCREQSVQPVAIPPGVRIAVVDSGLRHDLSDGSYAQRRHEVAQAESRLGKSLRDCDFRELEQLQDPLLRVRARHVISENQRVRQFAAALEAGDFAGAGALMYASHTSLAQDFEVSCTALDDLVRAAAAAGAIGARMTGGGFGGSMVCLVEDEKVAGFRERLFAAAAGAGNAAELRWVQAGAGASAEQLP